jgi:butyrate kinase
MAPAEFTVLAINPGSTSTKIAVYKNDRAELVRHIAHSDADLIPFRSRPRLDQLDFRQAAVEHELRSAGYTRAGFHAVVARGGLLRPCTVECICRSTSRWRLDCPSGAPKCPCAA